MEKSSKMKKVKIEKQKKKQNVLFWLEPLCKTMHF